jgi:hypothetical protein
MKGGLSAAPAGSGADISAMEKSNKGAFMEVLKRLAFTGALLEVVSSIVALSGESKHIPCRLAFLPPLQ